MVVLADVLEDHLQLTEDVCVDVARKDHTQPCINYLKVILWINVTAQHALHRLVQDTQVLGTRRHRLILVQEPYTLRHVLLKIVRHPLGLVFDHQPK